MHGDTILQYLLHSSLRHGMPLLTRQQCILISTRIHANDAFPENLPSTLSSVFESVLASKRTMLFKDLSPDGAQQQIPDLAMSPPAIALRALANSAARKAIPGQIAVQCRTATMFFSRPSICQGNSMSHRHNIFFRMHTHTHTCTHAFKEYVCVCVRARKPHMFKAHHGVGVCCQHFVQV
jgi:hypothetical protein